MAEEVQIISRIRHRDHYRFLIGVGSICGDVAVIGAAAPISSWLRFDDIISGNAADLLVAILFPYLLGALLFNAFQVEHLRNPASSIRRAVTAFVVSFTVAVVAAFAFKVSDSYSRLEIGYLIFIVILGLILWRQTLSWIVAKWFALIVDPSILILGDSTGLADRHFQVGAVEIIDVGARGWTPRYDDPDYLDHLAKSIGIPDRVILVFGDDQVRLNWITFARIIGLEAEIWQPNLLDTPALGLNNLNGATTLVVSRGPLQIHERALKRLFDLCLTIPGLILLSPLMILVAVLIKLLTLGPTLFVQERVGLNNHKFNMFKFRTMIVDSESKSGGQSTKENDIRITKLGAFLRHFSLDELPQLFNVLKGDMSLIGPRPHALGSVADGELFWVAADNYWARHSIKPGITGLAQIRGLRGGEITKEDIKLRVSADLEYANNWTILLDIIILIKTINVVVHPKAY